MKNSSEPVPQPDVEGLEFPDWSGMISHESRLTFAQAIQWNEEMLEMFPPKSNRAALDSEARCDIEFVL